MVGIRRALPVTLCVLLVVAASPLASGAAEREVDNTVTRIEVAADGSAVWTVSIRTRLENESEVEEYQAFQRQFRNDTARYLGPFEDRIRGIVGTAENATGREMRATNFSASTSIQELPRRWGVVTYRFRWEGFARTTDTAVIVDDVFQGGFYLAENDILVISAPSGYGIESVEPSPATSEGGTLRWTGPVDFTDQHPRARFAPEETGTATTVDRAETAPAEREYLLPGLLVLGLLAVVAGILIARRREPTPETESGPTRPTEELPADPETATDSEVVRALLATHSGRMKQAEIAEALGWSASKTSRVISRMAEEGTVEKLRLGRENVIELAESAD